MLILMYFMLSLWPELEITFEHILESSRELRAESKESRNAISNQMNVELKILQ